MRNCLVLNADYTPIDVVSWKDAITMTFSEEKNAYPIEYHETKIKDSANREHYLPSIIVLKRYVSNRNETTYSKYTRYNIFTRDGFKCQYCGNKFSREDLTIDHVIPISRYKKLGYTGRINCLTNVVTCCYPCNIRKGNFTCEEIGMFPIKSPRKITKKESLVYKLVNMKIPKEWDIYINNDFKNK